MRRSIETGSFFLLLVVVVLRPLITESYDSTISEFTAALGAVSDPSPVRTYVFDLLILFAAGGWLFARALGPRRSYRATGLGWGAALVTVAAIVSCLVAGHKRLAVNASIDWICYPILTITLVQLMYEPWRRRLLLAAILASATAQAATCFDQHFWGFDETWEHYESIKEDFWTRQGVDLDSGKVEAFERRIKAREATGHLPHSNVTGSYLVLCAAGAIGLVVSRWKRTGTGIGWLVAIVSTAGALWIAGAALLTKSAGALIAGGVGGILWLILRSCRSWIDARRTKALVIGWGCVAAGILAVIGYGLHKDTPSGWSLTFEWQSSVMFRWQYWRASSALIADHALTGVGRENFGRHYLRYKPIKGPEEIANPHNLFVQAAADWGMLGVIGVVGMMVGASLMLTRRRSEQGLPTDRTRDPPGRYTITPWAAALGLVVIVGRLPLLGTDDPNYLYSESVTTGLFWLIGFIVFGYGVMQPASRNSGSEHVVAMGVAIGLFTFLLHDMINFAMFVPATATTFFALLGLWISGLTEERAVAGRLAQARWQLPLGALTAGIVVVLCTGLYPVARAAHYLKLAREAAPRLLPAPPTAQPAHQYFQKAAEADPLDPTPFTDQAEWLMRAASVPEFRDAALEAAVESIGRAIERDPHSLRLRRMQMRVYQERAETTGSNEDYLAAIDAAGSALELYPLDPRGISALADCQLEAGRAAHSAERLREAITNYERALAIDDERLTWEELHRLRPKERQTIQSKIEYTQRLVTQGP